MLRYSVRCCLVVFRFVLFVALICIRLVLCLDGFDLFCCALLCFEFCVLLFYVLFWCVVVCIVLRSPRFAFALFCLVLHCFASYCFVVVCLLYCEVACVVLHCLGLFSVALMSFVLF